MKKLWLWLGAAAILVITFGAIYAVVQTAQRSQANYPQIQIAEDTATALNQGAKPAQLVAGNINLASDLAPFTIVYDKTGRVVAGSGYLHGAVPKVPYGVLRNAQGKTYHVITWQPEAGVRIATVSVAAHNYYVLSGRSLTEVEKNETLTMYLSMIGCLSALIVLAIAYLATAPAGKR